MLLTPGDISRRTICSIRTLLESGKLAIVMLMGGQSSLVLKVIAFVVTRPLDNAGLFVVRFSYLYGKVPRRHVQN